MLNFEVVGEVGMRYDRKIMNLRERCGANRGSIYKGNFQRPPHLGDQP